MSSMQPPTRSKYSDVTAEASTTGKRKEGQWSISSFKILVHFDPKFNGTTSLNELSFVQAIIFQSITDLLYIDCNKIDRKMTKFKQ